MGCLNSIGPILGVVLAKVLPALIAVARVPRKIWFLGGSKKVKDALDKDISDSSRRDRTK